MILVKKLNFFHFLNLGKISQINVFDDILDRKKAFLDSQNIDLRKEKKIAFFWRGYTMVFVKNLDSFFSNFPFNLTNLILNLTLWKNKREVQQSFSWCNLKYLIVLYDYGRSCSRDLKRHSVSSKKVPI